MATSANTSTTTPGNGASRPRHTRADAAKGSRAAPTYRQPRQHFPRVGTYPRWGTRGGMRRTRPQARGGGGGRLAVGPVGSGADARDGSKKTRILPERDLTDDRGPRTQRPGLGGRRRPAACWPARGVIMYCPVQCSGCREFSLVKDTAQLRLCVRIFSTEGIRL
jgi:hypothetical protein